MPRGVKSQALRRVVVAAGVLLGGLAGACSLALNFSGIDDGVRDGSVSGPDQTSPGQDTGTGSLEAGQPDEASPPLNEAGRPLIDGGVGDTGPDAYPDGPCGALPGPAMVLIDGTFCIDSTEVTVAQFTRFLQAAAGSVTGQPPDVCAWNTSPVPQGFPAKGPTTQPVSGVNWCQAALYCSWAGKQLCGTPDGSYADPSGYADPTQSLWFNVCSHNHDGLHEFPYGNTYDPTLCNGADYDAGQPLPSLGTCVGGYPGVFDMSGNVYEWENRCMTNDAGAGDFCFTRGGAYDQVQGSLTCDEGILYTRNSNPPNIGVRCCAFPPDAGN